MTTINKTIVWVHGDCLSPTNPALKAYANAPAIFVWDEAVLAHYNLSLKRMVFLYECLLELPVSIRRGNVADEVAAFAREHNAIHIATTPTPAPYFGTIAKSLTSRNFKLEQHELEPFLSYEGHLDLKRFSRYWRTAKKHL